MKKIFKKHIVRGQGLRVISLLFLFFLWYILASLDFIDETLIAHPREVFQVFIKSFDTNTGKSELVHLHTISTILLALEGWGISMLIGVLLGVLVGQSKFLLNLIEPIIDFIRSIPPILVFPLFLVGFNYDINAYVWTIVFGCLPIVVITVSKGISQITQTPFDILKYIKIKNPVTQVFYFIEIIPSIILSARLSFSFSIIIGIVCEMVFTPRNGWALGALARDSEINFDTPVFYACVIIIGLYGYFINRLFIKLEENL